MFCICISSIILIDSLGLVRQAEPGILMNDCTSCILTVEKYSLEFSSNIELRVAPNCTQIRIGVL